MNKNYKGLLFIKHGRVGTKSEGPDYFLQTRAGDFLLHYKERHPWEPDYELEFFCRRMVEIEGTSTDKVLTVRHIQPILDQPLPRG
ncbi:hypothetical protein GX408_16390 [bacterium]|nr:hypothetical protein [bacterium]